MTDQSYNKNSIQYEIKYGRLFLNKKSYILTQEKKLNSYCVKYQNALDCFSYVNFENRNEFINFYNEGLTLGAKGVFFHECISSDGLVKLFFDIDIEKSNPYFLMPNSILESYILTSINNVIKSSNFKVKLIAPIIATNHRDEKKSFRIIFKNIIFEDIETQKIWVSHHFKNILNDIIDFGVYKKGLCRFVFSSKRGVINSFECNNKLNKIDTHFFINVAEVNEKMHKIFIDDLVKINKNVIENKEQDEIKNTKIIKIKYIDANFINDLIIKKNSNNINILKGYELKKSSDILYRLNNKGDASCFITNGKIHKRDNTLININKLDNGTKSISLFCNSCNESCLLLNNFVIKKSNFYESIKEEYESGKIYNHENKNFTNHYTENEYLKLEDVKEYINSLIYLTLPCGKGKTYLLTSILNYICNDLINYKFINNELVIIIVSCRITLTSEIIDSLNKCIIKFETYLNNTLKQQTKTTIKNFKSNFRIVSPESFYLNRDLLNQDNKNKEIVIINEELPALIMQFNSISTHGIKRRENQQVWETLNMRASSIICLSGTPDKSSTNYLNHLSNLNKHSFSFSKLEPVKNLYLFDDKEKKLFDNLKDKIINNSKGRIAICWMSGATPQKKGKTTKLQDFEKLLKIHHGDKKVLTIYSGTDEKVKKDFIEDIGGYLEREEIDILIFTSTMYIGVNVLKHFEATFAYVNFKCINGASDIIQSIWRLRNCDTVYMIMSYFTKNYESLESKFYNDTTNFNIVMTEDKELNKLELKNSSTIQNVINKRLSLEKCVNDMNIDFNVNFIPLFIKHLEYNRIKLNFYEVDKNEKIINDVLKNKEILNDYHEELLNNYIDKYNETDLITVNEFEKISQQQIKNEEDKIKISKYFLYKGGYYSEKVTRDIIVYGYKFKNEISNIRYLTNFKFIENESPDIKSDYIEKMKIIKNMMNKYDGLDVAVKTIMYNNLLKRFKIKTDKIIKEDDISTKEKIKKSVEFQLKHIDEVLSVDNEEAPTIENIIYLLNNEKFKRHVAITLLTLFNLPILENKIYSKNDYEKLNVDIRNILNVDDFKNSNILKAYLVYLNYDKSKLESLINVMQDEKGDEDNKGIGELLKKIYLNYGMSFKMGEKNHIIYELKIRENLRNILSVFKEENKIPIINLFEDDLKFDDIDDITRLKINKLKLLLSPIKEIKKKPDYINSEEERLKKLTHLQLRELLKEKNIKGFSKKSKNIIIARLML